MINCRNIIPAILGPILLFSIYGCGGGGAGNSGSNSTSQTPTTNNNQATTIHVDVTSGQVTVIPPKSSSTSALKSNAVFTGSSIAFNTSQLLDVPGNVGLKTLRVSLTNHWGLPIGQNPDGTASNLKVVFSPITNVSAFSDLRSKTLVSTIAGNGAIGATDGSAANATFNGPSGVAVDNNGNIYVTDIFANNIRKISNGYVSTLAGGGTAGVNGTGAVAGFNNPYGIAYNSIDGSLVVTEVSGNRVRRVTPDGRVTTIAGTGSVGAVNGTGDVASLNGPAGVVVDSIGNIYVAEINGNRIRKIVRTGSDPTLAASYTVSTFAGSGAAGNQDGTGTNAAFKSPAGLAIDPGNVIYAVDQSNNKIRRIDTSGNVSTIAGTGMGASTDGTGNIATFNKPRGIVYVNNALVVAEELGNSIRQISLIGGSSTAPNNPASWRVSTIAGTGSAGTSNGTGNVATFNSPELICANQSGDIFITEINGHDIRKIVPISGYFPIGVTSSGTSADNVLLSNPDGVIPNPSGSVNPLYINYDGPIPSQGTSAPKNWNFTIPSGVTAFEFTVTVEANTTTMTPPETAVNAGSPNVSVRTLSGNNIGYIDGYLSEARFNGPEFIASDKSGNLYVADQYNCAVRRIGVNGIVSTVAGKPGSSAAGFADGYGNVAQLSYPSCIAVKDDGSSITLFVADTVNHRVRRIYASNSSDLTSSSSWYVSTVAGTGTAGNTNGTGDGATLNSPFGVVVTSGGNLYVSEYSGNRIRRIQYIGGNPTAASSWVVSLLSGDNSGVTGTTGTTDGNSGSVRFNHPAALALDISNNIYVADAQNHRIRVLTPEGTSKTIAGGVSGDTATSGYLDGPGSTARFNSPTGIALDSAGMIYVADSGDNHIRRVTPTGSVTTVAGTGSSGATNGTGDIATFNNPEDVYVDPSGSIYVGSVNDNSIRLIQRIISDGVQ